MFLVCAYVSESPSSLTLPACLPACLSHTQVWNMNAYCGVVGAFNLQGSSWDRVRRKFYVHDSKPPPLSTQVGERLRSVCPA